MNLLVPLAALLGFELETIRGQIRRTLVGNAVMLGLSLIGAGFMLIAGFLGLATLVGAIYAALIFGAVFLMAAFAIYLSMRSRNAREHRAAVEKRRSGEAGAFVTTAALTALPVVLRSPGLKYIGLPAAAIAAFFLIRGKKTD